MISEERLKYFSYWPGGGDVGLQYYCLFVVRISISQSNES